MTRITLPSSFDFLRPLECRGVERLGSGGLPNDERLGTRIVSDRSDARERLDHRHRAGELQTSRLFHFADDEDLLASVLVRRSR